MAEERTNEMIQESVQSEVSEAGAEQQNPETVGPAPEKEPETEGRGKELLEAKEAPEAQKAAQKEAKARQKQEALEEKARQKREALEEKLRRRQEKKEAKAVVKQERRKEVKSLLHTAEFAMLVTFIVLAIDQAGIYGFLFVWLFVAVMVASIVLLLLGIVRAVRKKRNGIIFFAAVVGIIVCTAWFIFLVSSQGLGLGPVPN